MLFRSRRTCAPYDLWSHGVTSVRTIAAQLDERGALTPVLENEPPALAASTKKAPSPIFKTSELKPQKLGHHQRRQVLAKAITELPSRAARGLDVTVPEVTLQFQRDAERASQSINFDRTPG